MGFDRRANLRHVEGTYGNATGAEDFKMSLGEDQMASVLSSCEAFRNESGEALGETKLHPVNSSFE